MIVFSTIKINCKPNVRTHMQANNYSVLIGYSDMVLSSLM